MQVSAELCTGCGVCIPFCPAGAITRTVDAKIAVDEAICVECGTCRRVGVMGCPTSAFYEPPRSEEWPRAIRKCFSSPDKHIETVRLRDKGSYGVTTNDVTNNVRRGAVGVAVELGQPVLGTSIRDVERFTQRLAASNLHIRWEPRSSLVDLFESPQAGAFRPGLQAERVLSARIEFEIPEHELGDCLSLVVEAAQHIDTVASVSVIARLTQDGMVPPFVLREVDKSGLHPSRHGVVNLGVGRPNPHPENYVR